MRRLIPPPETVLGGIQNPTRRSMEARHEVFCSRPVCNSIIAADQLRLWRKQRNAVAEQSSSGSHKRRPWFGTAGNVLGSDSTSDKDGKVDFLWIGFNSATEWQKFLANPNGLEIGGTVVFPSTNGMNFHFDPNTTTTTELGVPEIFTTIDGLKADPTATNLADHTHRWFISVKVEQIK